MSMPGDYTFGSGTSWWGGNLTTAVLNGSFPEWRLDDMATRIMAAYFKVGQDPETYPETNFDSWTTSDYGYLHNQVQLGWGLVNKHVNVMGDHHIGIREVGAKSTVLLKNVDGVLLSAASARLASSDLTPASPHWAPTAALTAAATRALLPWAGDPVPQTSHT